MPRSKLFATDTPSKSVCMPMPALVMKNLDAGVSTMFDPLGLLLQEEAGATPFV